MKKRQSNFKMMLTLFACAVLTFIVGGAAFALPSIAQGALTGLALGGGAIATYASMPIWFKMVDNVKTFMELSEEEIGKLTPEERQMYYKDAFDNIVSVTKQLETEIAELKDPAEKAEKLAEQLGNYKTMFESLKQAQVNQGEIIEQLKRNGLDTEKQTFESIMKAAWDEAIEADALKDALKNKGTMSIEVSKATQTYGDITQGSDFAQMREGIIDQPVRMPKIRSFFPTTPVSTEFFKYVEQTSVIRDAKNVAKCAAVTSTTKEELTVSSITTKVVKDMIDFCRLFVDDYPFMQTRINRLINQSVSLKVDSQLLLGDNTGENLAGIDFYSSEFSATNPACPLNDGVNGLIQAATMVDLILGMQTQIIELGQQEGYDPNVVLVNKCDWFVQVESRKDLDNNYIDSRVSMINGTPFIGGMMVAWSPIVPANTLYVMDSTKGEIIDRMSIEIDVAFENKDNWEKEIATLKGLERLNLLVPNEWANAFMKCTDVSTAVAAITKP